MRPQATSKIEPVADSLPNSGNEERNNAMNIHVETPKTTAASKTPQRKAQYKSNHLREMHYRASILRDLLKGADYMLSELSANQDSKTLIATWSRANAILNAAIRDAEALTESLEDYQYDIHPNEPASKI